MSLICTSDPSLSQLIAALLPQGNKSRYLSQSLRELSYSFYIKLYPLSILTSFTEERKVSAMPKGQDWRTDSKFWKKRKKVRKWESCLGLCMKHKKQLWEERVYMAYTSIPLFITKGGQDGNSNRPELMQSPFRVMLTSFLLLTCLVSFLI